MKRTIGKVLGVFLAAGALLAVAAAPGEAYMGIKGGLFMPNGDSDGLKDWENGYGGEIFFGGDVGPVSIELGIGGYTTKPDSDADDSLNTAYGAGTAKLYLPLGPVSLYGGGGAGWYFSKFGDEDFDGNGLGIHAVGGAEFSLGVASLLAEIRWSQVKIEFNDASEKTNVGGLMANIGIIF